MDLIKKICSEYFKEYADINDSPKYKEQSRICNEIYEDLYKELSESQQKKLHSYNYENFMLSGQWLEDGFSDGVINGFKLAFRIFIDALK